MAYRFPPLGPDDPPFLGPYQLAGVLGSGGMGKVYLGRSPAGRGEFTPVAVKVLLPELADEQQLIRRFAREAHAALQVRSPRVARVLGQGDGGGSGFGQPWIATEFLAGPTLAEAIVRYGPFPEPAVRALGAELGRALADIHGSDLVHRDLKPGNIVLTSSGPKVIDFGIARPEHGMTLTAPGHVPTTPGYSAPEQLLGQRVGPSADLFALGAVLVRAATGRSAFPAGEPHQVSYAVVYGEPELAHLPDGLRKELIGCLAKDPAQRPEPARLVRALEGRRLPGVTRGTDRFWRGGLVAEEIAAREVDVRQALGSGVRPAGGPRVPRRRFTALAVAGAGAVLAGGGALLARIGGAPGDGDMGEPNGAVGAPAERSSDAEPLAEYTPGVAPEPYWTADVAVGGVPYAPPVPVDDLVVVPAAEGGGLAAYRVDPSEEENPPVWTQQVADPAAGYLAAGPADDELLLAAGADGTVLCCRTESGEPEWDAAVDALLLLAADEQAGYLLTGDHRLVAVELDGGAIRWEVAAGSLETDRLAAGRLDGDGGSSAGGEAQGDDRGEGDAATGSAGGLRVAASGHGRLLVCDGAQVVAFDTDTGDEVWSRAGDYPAGPLPPALTARVCCLGGAELVALDPADGAEQWRHQAGGADGWGAPALTSDGQVCALNRLDLFCYEAGDGTHVWRTRLDPEAAVPPHPPVIQNNGVWVVLGGSGSSGVTVRQLDGGQPAWTYTDGQTGPWMMAGRGNRVFLCHGERLLAMPVP